MIAVDTNILVYAHRPDGTFHKEARECIEELAEGRTPWGIPWPCVHEFIGVATHPRIYAPPSTLEQALDQVNAWLESPSLVLLAEPDGYWTALEEAARGARAGGPMIHDARIAALCRVHGVRELWSADRDFHRFADLEVRNPLAPGRVHEPPARYGRRRKAGAPLRRRRAPA